MKTAIIYASVHHENTKKVVDAIAKENEIEVIDATQITEKNLAEYDRIGFASGIYYSKFHKSVLKFADANLQEHQEVFLICTYGPFKLIGGVAKGHPDEKDLADAVQFYRGL